MAYSRKVADAFSFKFATSILGPQFKDLTVIGFGLAEYLGHIEPVDIEDPVFDVINSSTLGVSLPAHIHTGIATVALEECQRELALLARYDRRLRKQARPATETEQRRISVLADGVIAHCGLRQLQAAMKAHYAEYRARQRATSVTEAV